MQHINANTSNGSAETQWNDQKKPTKFEYTILVEYSSSVFIFLWFKVFRLIFKVLMTREIFYFLLILWWTLLENVDLLVLKTLLYVKLNNDVQIWTQPWGLGIFKDIFFIWLSYCFKKCCVCVKERENNTLSISCYKIGEYWEFFFLMCIYEF